MYLMVEFRSVQEGTANREPEAGKPAISTSPVGARVMDDGADTSISSINITNAEKIFHRYRKKGCLP
jgi:hypothetical protein